MKTRIMAALLFTSAVAIAGLSWRCAVLQRRCDQMQIRLQTSQITNAVDWHKIALSTVKMVRNDWIVIDMQERKLEETPEVVQLVCQHGGGTLRYCAGITAPITEQLRKMRSDVESMRESKDGGMLELEKLGNIPPAQQ